MRHVPGLTRDGAATTTKEKAKTLHPRLQMSRMTEGGGGAYSWEAGFPGDPRRCFLGNRSVWTCFSRVCSTCV